MTDRHMGQHAHRQYDPEHDLVRQSASLLLATARFQKGLLHNLRRDNLPQALQTIQNVARILRGYHAASLPRHRHSLPETSVREKHKVSDGCDLREYERYCAMPFPQVHRAAS